MRGNVADPLLFVKPGTHKKNVTDKNALMTAAPHRQKSSRTLTANFANTAER